MLGGSPVRPDGPPAWPRADSDVQAALAELAASSAWGLYHGEQVPGLEAELAAFHGVPHAIACASGTVAVEAALRALQVGPGDEVLMAAYDYEPNFLSIHALGAFPVLVDVAPGNWNLDPAALEDAHSPRTKAILCSHLHGGIVPMREVMAFAARRNLKVVEDAAQAARAIVQGQPAGTWGDIGTLSFGGSKLLTAGRGGALLIRDRANFQRAKLVLNRGIQPWAPLSELQAAVLRPQLRKLPECTRRRAENAARLKAAIAAVAPGLVPLENVVGDSEPAYYKLGFRYDAAAFGLPRETFVRAMRGEGIAFDAGFTGLHVGRSPSRLRVGSDLKNATAAHDGCVTLHHSMLLGSADEIQQVADAAAKIHAFRKELA